MALMMGALYDALINGGTTDEKARKAAEEVAGYETRLAAIDTRLAVLTWMVGFNLVLSVAAVIKLFT